VHSSFTLALQRGSRKEREETKPRSKKGRSFKRKEKETKEDTPHFVKTTATGYHLIKIKE
jgi:hypothetical protein